MLNHRLHHFAFLRQRIQAGDHTLYKRACWFVLILLEVNDND